MGAWGFKALESDEGLDVVDFLKDHLEKSGPDWTLAEVTAAIRAQGFLGESFEDIDSFYDNSAMALAELYFEFRDNGKLHYKDDDGGLAFGKLRSFTADAESLKFLLRCLTDIRDEVPDADGERELVELWRDSDDYEAWKANLSGLIERLEKKT
jgi:hypothetical protein